MLFKDQRNDIFNALVNSGLQPTDFVESNKDEKLYGLVHKQTSFTLVISNILPYYKYQVSPQLIGIGGEKLLSWGDCLLGCRKWMDFVKSEINTPDLWAEAQTNAELFKLDLTAPNEMFNGVELRQLEGQVRQLVQGLEALRLPAHVQKLLTETIQEIPDKATRFTKKELAGWFMGAFVAQVTNLALSQEHVSAIAHLIKTTFMGLLQLH